MSSVQELKAQAEEASRNLATATERKNQAATRVTEAETALKELGWDGTSDLDALATGLQEQIDTQTAEATALLTEVQTALAGIDGTSEASPITL